MNKLQILMKTFEPTLNQAYALIIEDGSQRSNPYPALGVRRDPIAMQVVRGQGYKGKKPFMKCDYCKMTGHLKENCYKLIGYPAYFNAKRKVVANYATGNAEHEEQAHIAGGKAHNDGPVGGHFFNENQYKQILDVLNKDTTIPQVNMAGIATALMTDNPSKEWIVDFGATHHIAASLDILHSKTKLKIDRDQVHLPTGKKTNISHIGSAIFLKDMEIKNDLWSGRVRGIGKERGGLYVVKDEHIARSLRLRSIILQGKSPYELLHHQKPSLEHLRVCGCLCYATTMLHDNKFSVRAKPIVHLGYSDTQKGYKLLDLATNHFFVCRDVVFKEHLFPFAKSSSLHPVNVFARGSASFEHEPLQGHAADHTFEPLHTPAADHASKSEVDTTIVIHEAHENDEVDAVYEEGNIADVVVSEEGNIDDVVVSKKASEPQQATHDEHAENDVPECVSLGIRTKKIWQKYQITHMITRLCYQKKAHNVALYPISNYQCYDQLSQGDLYEEVYMGMPQGFRRQGETKVCKLVKSLYGLKQASRKWNIKPTEALLEVGYKQSLYDYSLFTKKKGANFVAVLGYVDDLLITGNNEQFIQETKDVLNHKFKVKDLGELKYFLGVEVMRSNKGILLNQRKYALQLISDMGLGATKPASTPIDMNHKIHFSKLPKQSHWEAALRVVKYIKLNPGMGILLSSKGGNSLTCFCDANWAACPNTRRLVTCFFVKYGDSLVSWKSKKQQTMSRSLVEAEYRSLATTTAEIVWLLGLFTELGISVEQLVNVFCDSKAALQIASNPKFHERLSI
uniref:Uncharacterized protein LOC104223583 n=1 Tax=Nicotiana sylvestris TaxID=4096 RepID=A0A1U7WFB9_NICSY|nr:PREDICTED: uncharacterized protein LOC104223583 [Nicotiana sylvestris]